MVMLNNKKVHIDTIKKNNNKVKTEQSDWKNEEQRI